MSSNEFVNIGPVTVKRMSGKAALLLIKGEEHWMPFSQVDEATAAQFDDDAKLEKCVVKEWIAKEKELSFE